MVKVALFDVDGVVIKARERFFSDRLMQDYGLTKDQAMELVHEVIVPSMTGKVDLREVLPHYLELWKIPLSVDELFAYWWSGENTLTQEIIELVDELKAKGIYAYLATDQERYRGGYIMNELGLSHHFNGGFFSYSMNHTKSEREFWDEVISQLGVSPNEIVYWDDDQKNVDLASELGIASHLYTDIDGLKKEIDLLQTEGEIANQ